MNKRQQYRLGMAAYNASRYSEAIAHLGSLANDGRGARRLLSRFYLAQAHYYLAIRLFKKKHFREASAHFHSAAQANPSGGGFARFLAACYVGAGQLSQAACEWESLLRADPDDYKVRIRLALTRWKQGAAIEAISCLREGLRRTPESAELCYQLGVMLAADDELVEAESLFVKTITLDTSHAAAHERLAQCCSVNNRHERALDYLKKAHELDPMNSRITLQLSLLVQSMAEYGQEPAVELKATPVPPAFDEASLDRLGETIIQEPDFVQAFLSLPETEVDEEVFSVLAATMERALRKRPEFADLHYHCSTVYRRMGKNTDALQHAEQAVQLNPRYVHALILLAKLYGQTDRWTAGVERLEEAIREGADYPDVHCLVGQLCQEDGQLDRARQAYERALVLNGEYQAARDALDALPA